MTAARVNILVLVALLVAAWLTSWIEGRITGAADKRQEARAVLEGAVAAHYLDGSLSYSFTADTMAIGEDGRAAIERPEIMLKTGGVLHASEGTINIDDGTMDFRGGARLSDSQTEVRADTMSVNPGDSVVSSDSETVLTAPNRRISADGFMWSEDRFAFQGDVKMTLGLPEESGR